MSAELLQPLVGVEPSTPKKMPATQARKVTVPVPVPISHFARVGREDLRLLTHFSNRMGYICGGLTQMAAFGLVAVLNLSSVLVGKLGSFAVTMFFFVLLFLIRKAFFESVLILLRSRSHNAAQTTPETAEHYEDVAQHLSYGFQSSAVIAISIGWALIDVIFHAGEMFAVYVLLGAVCTAVNMHRQPMTEKWITQTDEVLIVV